MSDQQRNEALPMSLDAHVAVQTVELRHVRETVDRVETKLGNVVTRNEWEQRNGHVDGRLEQQQTQITQQASVLEQFRRDLDAKRAPWWVIAGAATGVGSLLIMLIPKIAQP